MFHSRTMNNKVSRIHERDLRLVYSDYSFSFDELLQNGSFSIHDWNIQTLAIEIHTFFHGLWLSIMKNIFQVNTNNPYSVRSSNELYCRNPKTVKHGTEKYGYLAPRYEKKQNQKMET